jgi:hypothetical protein
MSKKLAVAMLAVCLVVAAMAVRAAFGPDDPFGEAAYLSAAIGQPLL